MAKYVKIGNVLNVTDKKTGEPKKTLKLGQEGSNNTKYNYTVELRVKDSEGNVVAKVTNPWVNLNTPHEKAPKSILNELQITVQEES